MAVALFNLLLFLYSIVQVNQRNKNMDAVREQVNQMGSSYVLDRDTSYSLSNGIQYAIIGIVAAFAFTYILEAYRLYQLFGWDIYKKIGADMRMRRGLMCACVCV